MRERKQGTILNVASTTGFQPVPYMATYAATKAFVLSFSEALWEENREHGVHVMALCPGVTETNFFAASKMDRPPMRTIQTPEEVVDTALRGLGHKKPEHHFGLDQLARCRSRTLRSAFVSNKDRGESSCGRSWKSKHAFFGGSNDGKDL